MRYSVALESNTQTENFRMKEIRVKENWPIVIAKNYFKNISRLKIMHNLPFLDHYTWNMKTG